MKKKPDARSTGMTLDMRLDLKVNEADVEMHSSNVNYFKDMSL
jgi:hypothetical protein